MNQHKEQAMECFLCGSTKHVQTRSLCYGWWWECKRVKYARHSYPIYPFDGAESGSALCMSCWNKVKPLVKLDTETDELLSLINQLEKDLINERRGN